VRSGFLCDPVQATPVLADATMKTKQLLAAMSLLMTHAAFAGQSLNSASDFLGYLYPDRQKVQPVVYHDMIMGDQYHLYFTFTENAAPDYKKWTAQRIKKEVIPAFDQYACMDRQTARPGDAMRWPEFRRKGGAMVIHLSDWTDFAVDVEAPAKPLKCTP